MIDWSLLLASIINISKEHSLSMGLTKEYHKPAPSKWAIRHAYSGEQGKEQWAKRRKRNVTDSDGRTVAQDLDIPTADFVCQATPEAVMILMDTIDDMAQIIATHRNEGLLQPVHDPDQIRLYLLKKHSKLVQSFLKRQHTLILKKSARSVMAPQPVTTRRGGLKPSVDKLQQQINERQKTIDEYNRNKHKRSRRWKEKCKELGLSTPDLKELSQSRRQASTSKAGKRRSSNSGRNQSST